MRVLRGHKGDVLSVVISGGFVASAGYDKDIKVWHADSGKLLRSLKGHTSIIKSLCATTDDENTSYLVSGSWDNTVRLWNLSTGEAIQILQGHTNRVKAVTLYVTVEIFILSGGDDCNVILWSTVQGSPVKVFMGHSQPISCVAVSTGSPKHAASGSVDGTIRIWEMPVGNNMAKRPGRSVLSLDGHTRAVSAVVFSSFEIAMQLYSSGEDGVIIVWEYETGQSLRRVEGVGENISAMVCLCRDSSESIMTTSLDGTLRIWDPKTTQESKRENVRDGYLFCVDFTEDARGTAVVVGGSDGFLRLLPRVEDIFLSQDIAGQGLRIKFNREASVASTNGTSRVQFQLANKRTGQRPRSSALAEERNNLPKITKNVRYIGRDPLKKAVAGTATESGGAGGTTQMKYDMNPALDLQITKSPLGTSDRKIVQPGRSVVNHPNHATRTDVVSDSTVILTPTPRAGPDSLRSTEVGDSARAQHVDKGETSSHPSMPSGQVLNTRRFLEDMQREAPKVLQRRVKPQTASTIRRNRQLPKIYPHKREFVLTVSQYVEPKVSASASDLLQIYSYPTGTNDVAG